MRKSLQNLGAFGVGLLLSFCLIGLVEITLRLNKAYGWIDLRAIASANDLPSSRVVEKWDGIDKRFLAAIPDHFEGLRKKYGDRVYQHQAVLRFEPSPEKDGSYNFSKFAPDGEPIFSVHYRFNEKQRRPTPGQPRNPEESVYLVGCSYTIGEGLAEDETIAAYMQRNFSKTAVETLAFHGWGIGNHLNFLRGEVEDTEQHDPYRVLEKRPVVVIYPFIPDHIYRTSCPLLCYQQDYQWMLNFPNYEVGPGGEAKYLGSFADSRFFSPILKLIANSAIATQLGLGWVYPGSTTALEKYFAVLNAYRAELGKRVPIKDFYFVPIEPYFPFGEKVGAIARANGYKVIDLGKLALPEMVGKNPRIPFDGHFTPPVNYILSQLILSEVRKDHPELR
jgi:hypothetical protein